MGGDYTQVRRGVAARIYPAKDSRYPTIKPIVVSNT